MRAVDLRLWIRDVQKFDAILLLNKAVIANVNLHPMLAEQCAIESSPILRSATKGYAFDNAFRIDVEYRIADQALRFENPDTISLSHCLSYPVAP